VQARHNALESCRQHLNKELQKELSDQYHFKVIPFPHHIQRENKMLTGAGADRMQTGMREAYGKPSGSAALLNEGSEIFFIAVGSKKAENYARNLLKQIRPKLPCSTRVNQEYKPSK
ncbi:MAG: 50S ribosomal protein L16, partial [Candidatus Pacearchaeota archaeon]